MRPSLVSVLLVSSLAGCAANSPGRFTDQPLSDDAPLVRYMLACQAEGTAEDKKDPALEALAIDQLEDLVESAASRVAKEKLDYPTAQLGDFDFIVEVDRRDTPDYEEWFYSAFYPEDVGYGAKYLFDHAGLAKGYDAIDDDDAAQLAESIDDYVLGDAVLEKTEPAVRQLETKVRERLGISEADWFENERKYDSSVDWLGAFTEPANGWPFSHCRIEIPRGMFSGTLVEILQTYGHELLHCRIGEYDAVSEDQRTIEETSCEVFGARVVAELKREGRLPPSIVHRVDAGAEGRDELEDETEAADQGEDESDETMGEDNAALEAEFSRLKLLYRHQDVEFSCWMKTQERYGHEAREGSRATASESTSAAIGTLMDRMALADYVALIPEMTKLDDLSRLCAEARRSEHVSLAQARRILGERR